MNDPARTEYYDSLDPQHLLLAWNAHAQFPKQPKNSVRYFDLMTPYGVHPIGCGMLLLAEPALPAKTRCYGALALWYHDALEDTAFDLPPLPAQVMEWIHELTFQGGSAEEMKFIWNRSVEARLFKCYDKWWNLADGYRTWMKERGPEYQARYLNYTKDLAMNVEASLHELTEPGVEPVLNIIEMIKHFPA